jgi:SAM-dependent methyltransferase
MLDKPLQVDPRSRNIASVVTRLLKQTQLNQEQGRVVEVLKSQRDIETLRTIAAILPKRSGLSYSAEAMEKRSRQRLAKAYRALGQYSKTEIRTVLDVGCARAENARYLAEYGVSEYIGLDIDNSHFPLLDQLPAGSRLLNASAEEIPLPANSVDLAISFNVFEHIPVPTNALSEIVRVLRPGGVFFTVFGPTFNAAAGPHLTRVIDLPYMHHLFPENVIAEMAGREDAYFTVNKRPLSYYRESFFAERGFRLARYREQVDGRGFWVLKSLPHLMNDIGHDELAVNAITVALVKA